jgi:hypothetical protein
MADEVKRSDEGNRIDLKQKILRDDRRKVKVSWREDDVGQNSGAEQVIYRYVRRES